jgi:ribosomal protein S18 acetylase RimI-like enzyme
VEVEIRRLGPGDAPAVLAARALFDSDPDPAATRRFLSDAGHHLLIAYDRDDRPVGFVSGVETTHPDKGTEMFLYELAVDAGSRRHGFGRSLVEALADLARERGCYGMWVGVDADNVAALRTYERAGARANPPTVVLDWDFGGGSSAERA